MLQRQQVTRSSFPSTRPSLKVRTDLLQSRVNSRLIWAMFIVEFGWQSTSMKVIQLNKEKKVNFLASLRDLVLTARSFTAIYIWRKHRTLSPIKPLNDCRMNGRLLESTLRQISSEQYEIEQITGNNWLFAEIRLKIRQFLNNFPLSQNISRSLNNAENLSTPIHRMCWPTLRITWRTEVFRADGWGNNALRSIQKYLSYSAGQQKSSMKPLSDCRMEFITAEIAVAWNEMTDDVRFDTSLSPELVPPAIDVNWSGHRVHWWMTAEMGGIGRNRGPGIASSFIISFLTDLTTQKTFERFDEIFSVVVFSAFSPWTIFEGVNQIRIANFPICFELEHRCVGRVIGVQGVQVSGQRFRRGEFRCHNDGPVIWHPVLRTKIFITVARAQQKC